VGPVLRDQEDSKENPTFSFPPPLPLNRERHQLMFDGFKKRSPLSFSSEEEGGPIEYREGNQNGLFSYTRRG